MSAYFIRLQLGSDTTFGRGDGVAGWVDAEVEHDEYGLPFLRGRALKGLLAEDCANILYALGQQQPPQSLSDWRKAADCLFGKPGSGIDDDAKLRFGDALVPEDLRRAVAFAVEDKNNKLQRQDVLNSLTTIRRQTAMTIHGAPQKDSLRSMRVILRETVFDAELSFDATLQEDAKELILLGACAAALRRIGLGRNRGRGKVTVSLHKTDNGAEQDITRDLLDRFQTALAG